jgi:hypothetical protein
MKEKLYFWVIFCLALVLVPTYGFVFLSLKKGPKPSTQLIEQQKMRPSKDRIDRILSQPDLDMEKITRLEQLSSYQPLLERSPFFRPLPPQPPAPQEPGIALPLPPKEQRPQFSYKGSGRIKGKEVVFVEDKRAGETYFVSKNDMIGEYKVLDITEKEVLLSRGKETITLHRILPEEQRQQE